MRSDSPQETNHPTSIYQMLPEARPLQNKQLRQTTSFFTFTGQPAPLSVPIYQKDEELDAIGEDRDNSRQEIGCSLCELFQRPVYQSYEGLYLGESNERFATCNIKVKEVEQIRPKIINFTDKSILKFQSRFESGNLAIACQSQTNPIEYFLALQRDTNSRATCQWYYFSVENEDNTGVFTFNIVNLLKNYSAYQYGMKPCVLSTGEANEGWKRGGFDIKYRRNSIRYRNQRCYYTFSFRYEFTKAHDRVYFAYCYPYTFSKLQNFLLEKQFTYSNILNVRAMAKTLSGNSTQILSITNPSDCVTTKKDLILISARVHPGETNSSHVCEGLIEFLLGKSPEADNLRNQFMIKIIPFLNPDGVVHGNYRTSLTGVDLNRRWKNPDSELHPQIYQIKKYLSETEYKTALFIDLHGHSKKRSSFMYGCLNRQNPYLCKQFPFVLSKKGHCFSYFNCNFSTPVSREGTSRMNIWKQFGVDFSYTMEMSFCGATRSKVHFGLKDYITIGQELGRVMSLYFCSKKTEKSFGIQNLMEEFYQNGENLQHGEQDSDGSQSGEEEVANIVVEKIEKEQKPEKQKSPPKEPKKNVLQKFLNQATFRIPKREASINKSTKKIEERSSPTLRQRKSLAPSRISIQRIQLSSQKNQDRYIGFNKGNIKILNKDSSSGGIKGGIWKQQYSKSNQRQSYRPYSYCKSKDNGKLLGDDGSLILPSVVRKEEIRYRKYRNNQGNVQISLEMEKAPSNSSIPNSMMKREISLNEKINQGSLGHRRSLQTQRYWSKGN